MLVMMRIRPSLRVRDPERYACLVRIRQWAGRVVTILLAAGVFCFFARAFAAMPVHDAGLIGAFALGYVGLGFIVAPLLGWRLQRGSGREETVRPSADVGYRNQEGGACDGNE